MYTVENRVGCLVECVLQPPMEPGDVDGFARLRADVVTQMVGARVVCTDMSRMTVLAPETVERLIGVLRVHHGGPSRVGFLLPAKAVALMQIERVVREAGDRNRRTFRERAPLIEWLSETLQPDETQRLRDFLAAP